MSNEPQTYHLIVTLPATTGEEADWIAGKLHSDAVAYVADAEVEHLTPETLPGRYVAADRRMLAHVLTEFHGWENDRERLAEREAADTDSVRSNEWHGSDDSAVEIMRRFAALFQRED